ncbi:hypothetical protein [Paraclostridium sordellii]|uniref:Uncharacterized protein n=1 Tax=Paraclostridium sordellii TaxID=1505 RepID=A0A0C7G4L4_PARSO|nr:hypothetical protein [Paeniclostridium sordellii]CEN77885.1 Uncharacterised protein [[Clostridium] sordellii] [Paeniclostridium sordellii]CEQ02975.1 Uncharacterised protein [[Clostridium] sordellii] [Paeniclostridium sordellii]
MIGLIDVDMEFYYGVERVTLAFYRSSGTNNNKVKDLWYPIVGIKIKEGEFTEFSDYINYVLSNTTLDGTGIKGWLAKSLFFGKQDEGGKMPGFSNTKHYESLYYIGKTLRNFYNTRNYKVMKNLNAMEMNKALSSKERYSGNTHTQRENFERFIEDIFLEFKY